MFFDKSNAFIHNYIHTYTHERDETWREDKEERERCFEMRNPNFLMKILKIIVSAIS